MSGPRSRSQCITAMSSAGSNDNGIAVEGFAVMINECEEMRFVMLTRLALKKTEAAHAELQSLPQPIA